MSHEQTPPKSSVRKPRFFRPGDAGLPAVEKSAAVGKKSEESSQTAPNSHPDPLQPSQENISQATSRQTQETGSPRSASLHQPKDKRQAFEDNEYNDDLDDEPDHEDGSQTQGKSIPTLKDIKRGFRWTGIFMAALGALAAMAFTSWLTSFIDDLVVRKDWIGWLALGLVAIACLALLMIAIKELLALSRLKKLGNLREAAERALKHDERQPAQKLQSQITGLFHGRSSLSWGVAQLKEHEHEVLSARDRLLLIERNLMVPLDREARKTVANSAKRVSVMTAISPFAFLDMALVAVENFKMLRRLMTLYGGRPGLFSQFKMIQMMIANLALSGGIAVGADLLGHVMGRQVATKLAGRIGEGMINGSLTARLGITATKLIRPLPYIEAKPTNIRSFVKELTSGSKQKNRTG